MLDAFTPPTAPPTVIEIQHQATAPLVISSHGYVYRVTGNTALSEAVIKAVLLRSTTPKIAIDALETSYRTAGYPLVALRASIDKDHVTITVIEGAFNEISAPARIQPFYTGLLYDPEVRDNDMIRRNILVQSYLARSGEQPLVSIEPGQAPGSSKLRVNTTPLADYKPYRGSLSFGNIGSRYSSRYQWMANASADIGHGAQLFVSGARALPGLTSTTSGSEYKDVTAGGTIVSPWGIYGLTTEYTHYRLGEVAKPLYPVGNIHKTQLSGTQLLYADARSRFGLNETLTQLSNTQSVYGFYTLQDQRYRYLDVNGTYSKNYLVDGIGGGSTTFSFGLTKGVSPHAYTMNSSAAFSPQPRFSLWHWSVNSDQTLPRDWQLQGQLSGQWAADTLPSYNQWVLGGLGNLSAYYPGVLSGDSGYLARVTLTTPAWSWGPLSAKADLSYGWGGVHNFYRPYGTPHWQALGSWALGISASATSGTTLRVELGHAGGSHNVPYSTREQSRNSAFFFLTQSF